jgi:hypothetical protein
MSRKSLEERVAALEVRLGDLLANGAGAGRAKDWRRTRGAFTGDPIMKDVIAEARRIRAAEAKRNKSNGVKARRTHS